MNVQWRSRAERDVEQLDRTLQARVLTAIAQFASTGRGNIRRLQAESPPMFRLRVGDIRVLFRVPDRDTMIVERVLPRDKAYR